MRATSTHGSRIQWGGESPNLSIECIVKLVNYPSQNGTFNLSLTNVVNELISEPYMLPYRCNRSDSI